MKSYWKNNDHIIPFKHVSCLQRKEKDLNVFLLINVVTLYDNDVEEFIQAYLEWQNENVI